MTRTRVEAPQERGGMQRDSFLREVGNGILYKIPLKTLWFLCVRQGLRFRNCILYSQYTFMSYVGISEKNCDFFYMCP
jgi:hypothetical protein